MGTKRPRSDMETSDTPAAAGHVPPPSRPDSHSREPDRGGGRAAHHRPPADRGGRGARAAREGTLAWAKKRARTIERRLDRGRRDGDAAAAGAHVLPANVRAELERELAASRATVADAAARKARGRMIGKYHMVRFFERQKASRLVRQLERQLEAAAATAAADDEEVEEESNRATARLEADLHVARVDLAYATYYPVLERYVSLYPSRREAGRDTGEAGKDVGKKMDQDAVAGVGRETGEPGGRAALLLGAERPPLWKDVERAMIRGAAALEHLRDREGGAAEDGLPSAEDGPSSGPPPVKRKKRGRIVGARGGKAGDHGEGDNGDGEDGDGGFFEK